MIERIKIFIENQGISIRAFEKKISASNGLIRKAIANNTDIQAKWATAIVENFPHINPEWLLTGNGCMLRDDPENIGHTTFGHHSPINGNIEIDKYRNELELAKTKIHYLEALVKSKDETINILKESKG